MGTRILEGRRINENDKSGACFYDSTTGRAFGPMFEDAEEAERFESFLAGLDPRSVDWHHDFHTSPYRVWLSCGKLKKRPVVQFSLKDFAQCSRNDAEGDGHTEWTFHLSLVEHCFPLFRGWNNNEVCDQLKKDGVFQTAAKAGAPKESHESEHSCIYNYFDTKKQAEQFLERLNGWLRDNWHRAYPEST